MRSTLLTDTSTGPSSPFSKFPANLARHSIPYHLFTYIFPVHKYLFISLFLLVNLWTIFVRSLSPLSLLANTGR